MPPPPPLPPSSPGPPPPVPRAIHPTTRLPPAPHAALGPPGGTAISKADRITLRLHRNYWLFFSLRQWLWRHVTPAGAVVFWAMLVAGSFTDINQTMAHQLFGLLFVLLFLSLVSVRKPQRAFALQRFLPRQASVGTPFTGRLRLQNLTRRRWQGLAVWEGLPDPRPTAWEFTRLAEPAETSRNWFDRRYRFYRWQWLCTRNARARLAPLPLPDLAPGGTAEIPLTVTPLRRGRLTFQGAEMARTDPFGLFRRLAKVQETPAAVMVLPRRFRLPPLELPGRSHRLHPGGVALAGSVGDSEEFVAVRDYRPGDPLRRIHWAGWARTQRPVVKEFHEEFFVRHALLLDTFAGGPEADAFEDAVSLAASFASSVDERDSLLDLMFVGHQAYVFTAGRGLAHAEQMLEILAGVDLHPDGDVASLETLMLQHAGRLSGCILILLHWDAARRRLRERLEAHQVPTLTFVVHRQDAPAEAPLPPRVHWLRAGRIEDDLARLGG